MKQLSVLSTKEYARFRSLTGNRELNRAHVNKLIASIERTDYMQYQPILVTKDLYVIDGQHRLEAAKALKKEIYYTVLPDADLHVVQLLNANLKPWSIRDFCESFATLGNKHYKELIDFVDDNNINFTLAADLLGNSLKGKGKSIGKHIRAGTFTVKNRANAEETVRRIKDVQPFVNGAFWKSTTFIVALVTLYEKGMDHKLLVKQFQATGKRIYQQVNVRDYIIELLDVYNRGLKKNRIDLF